MQCTHNENTSSKITTLPALGHRQLNKGHLTLNMLPCAPPYWLIASAKPPRENDKILEISPPIDQECEMINGGSGKQICKF